MNFDWLQTIGTLPKVIAVGLGYLGVREKVGRGSNPVIMHWVKRLNDAGFPAHDYVDDDIPWCGLFVANVVLESGRSPVRDFLWAANWKKFGVAGRAELGSVLNFSRPGGNHVGFYIAETPDTFWVLGGNQNNQVSIVEIDKARLTAIRNPVYRKKPASVKPYFVNSLGEMSKNEA